MSRRFLITATPPTTNGDLHVGHLSGPYLTADVFARAQRAQGNETLYVSGGDDHQTFVVTTAERVGSDPHDLARECNESIRATLAMADIAIDAFTQPDDAYRSFVTAFFERLWTEGKLERRSYRFAEHAGRYQVEAFARGYCPECYVATSGGICETCGHPNDPDSLIAHDEPAQPSTMQELEVLVLPLERYRAQFERIYAADAAGMRPHVLRFVGEMLARPLPDFQVTYPASWGIPVTFGDFPGQVLNVWAEMLPALVWMTRAGAAQRDLADGPGWWDRGSGVELVQFLGYDNTFYFSLAHVGLALADGRMITPAAIVTNEFLHLEGSKFSTSRRHLIWARDLIERHGADDVRFGLALHNPEHQVANFVEREFETVVAHSLREPLASLLAALARCPAESLEVTTADVAVLARFRARMRRAYTLETFSLRQAAETLSNLLQMLAQRSAAPDVDERILAFALCGLRHWVAYAAPIVPGLSAQLAGALGGETGVLSLDEAELCGEVAVPRPAPVPGH